ncbi:MAG: ISL3 family transposase, partial [Streptosporangiales bacterium]
EHSYLARHYGKPRLKDAVNIAIDEFSVQKGHKYMTVVYDLDSSRVLFVGEGKGAGALAPFWKSLRCSGAKVKAVATDMSPAFIGAVRENLPNAKLVFDRFHITKMVNDRLSELRRALYRDEAKLNKRPVIKGVRWLLLKGQSKLDESKDEHLRLEQALEANRPLAAAYYLKEELQLLWKQDSVEAARAFLGKWAARAYAARVPILSKMANSLLAHRTGIFAWYSYPISTGPLEGLNNKIKVLKRKAYGYRDKEFFKLKILSMHQMKYELCG